MVTGSKPMAPKLGNLVGVLAAALGAALTVFAQVQLNAQVLNDGAPRTTAPHNFVIHETPESGAAVRFDDDQAHPHTLADFQGKIVLLNIWATWCPPCVKEIPALDRLVAAMNGTDVAVVAVSIDRKGIDAVRRVFAKLDVQKLAPYIDPSGEALRTVRAMGLPTSLLIDREGREFGRVVGPVAWDDDETVKFFRQVATPQRQTKR